MKNSLEHPGFFVLHGLLQFKLLQAFYAADNQPDDPEQIDHATEILENLRDQDHEDTKSNTYIIDISKEVNISSVGIKRYGRSVV